MPSQHPLLRSCFFFSASQRRQFRSFQPFDQQNCTLIFGSWTHDTSTLDYFLKSDQVGLESYIENEGWEMVSFSGIRRSLQYSCCPTPYTNLNYHLVVQRKPLFYVVNLVIPTAIITFISLVGFFMPSAADGERTEKVSAPPSLRVNTNPALSPDLSRHHNAALHVHLAFDGFRSDADHFQLHSAHW